MAKKEVTGYELSRAFWDFAFEHTEKIKPLHAAIYFFAVEHCNRLGWKDNFGFPTSMAMDAVGIKNFTSYNKALNDLVSWGMIKMIEKSKNQYSSNIISVKIGTNKLYTSLSSALSKHGMKHGRSTVSGTVSINKPITNEQGTNELLSDKNPTQSKPPKKNKCEYWKPFIAKWEQWYQLKKGEKYFLLEKDFAHLKKIHEFFKKRAVAKKIEFTEENLLAAFEYFLNRAWDKDDWLRNNFSIPNLLSQFNQIANGTNKKSSTAPQYSGGKGAGAQQLVGSIKADIEVNRFNRP